MESRGADSVADLLKKAALSQERLLISVVNWGEVYYAVWRAAGEAVAGQKMAELGQMPVEVIDVDLPQARTAAALKARHKLPHADGFAAALAIHRKAALVTLDRDFESVAKEVAIKWTSRA